MVGIGRDPVSFGLFGSYSMLSHQPGDPIQAANDTLMAQFGMNAGTTIRPTALLMHLC
jgi:hypothetical protein